ncbi:hypothetical protein [Blastococcus saxobsidens]|uniref:Uncharacterized protein n=1 Tax=Blastococcus saxobsidens TaxID=138336 RepID=A0A4V2G2B7_9ACTN|nr:hypothetical protein [Blastococcus saxobsidens]RZU32516.1 hypothetical protein BKA19_2211 [Blastococcus saxobsidens]
MRRTTRMVAGAVLAGGLALTGCGEGDTADPQDGTSVEEEFEQEEVGGPDPVDGGEEDDDAVDKGTGGLDSDDNTEGGGDGSTPDG